MSARLFLVTALAFVGIPGIVHAQSPKADAGLINRKPSTPPSPRQASAAPGGVIGLVTDEIGRSLAGVSIMAVGTTLAAVSSDAAGRFSLALPMGQYILRAAREGYVSTYREPIRVQTNVIVERRITMVRAAATAQPSALASTEQPSVAPGMTPEVEPVVEHSHTNLAWRLRHLPRSVLRDGSAASVFLETPESREAPFSIRQTSKGVAQDVVASFLGTPSLNGQVNFLTSSAVPWGSDQQIQPRWPRGIAYVVLGAPVGLSGAWSVRAAVAGGERRSWTLLGEYKTRAESRHALRVGLSYSMQSQSTTASALPAVVAESRSVGGISVSDRWRVSQRTEVELGLRVDRYDYLEQPVLFSQRSLARFRFAPRTWVTAAAVRREIAPGAEQFLPPTSSGPWLPPERTFSPLWSSLSMRPEDVRLIAAGLSRQLDEAGARTLSVDWFSQTSRNQLVALFGLNDASAVGHYYVASAGRVVVSGWRSRLNGTLATGVRGTIEYSMARADWAPQQVAARRWISSAAREGREWLHDFRATVEVAVPASSTHVTAAYRVSNGFANPELHSGGRVSRGRFNVQVRQDLPYRPIAGSTLNALFSVRTLLHDELAMASFFDELLTVRPPLRFTGGLQLWF